MSRSDTERLRDILECIEVIDRVEATVRRYPGDPDVAKEALDAVQRRVFTIGEAVKALSRGLRQRHPDVPWSDIARMRDLIGHHDYKLDPRRVPDVPDARRRPHPQALGLDATAEPTLADRVQAGPGNHFDGKESQTSRGLLWHLPQTRKTLLRLHRTHQPAIRTVKAYRSSAPGLPDRELFRPPAEHTQRCGS